ncbi:alanine racemase [Tenuifilum thalassicum]|uniref:Alanine/ornithine racemase family PLP-dependent enzyme n=1 Tax=Tenuifilum thalassicum TaxID=2590900 RepID=A0A7D4BDP4_9BACT|nr:alanine racemase [Tenuifilum thalassicum]QKG79498.1 alanine/ornithine racemase family PLP-dependent enzyme [Tenuifilum thalassicum]
MAELLINTNKLISNISKISNFLEKNNIQWSLIVKILSGNKEVLSKLLQNPEIKRIHSIGDSRISGLKIIKSINPDIPTIYIKPPPIDTIHSVVKYADISLNSSITTIRALNEEAKKQGKKHRVIIMIELGELREGVIRDNIIDFYKNVFSLENIEVEGIGTNLGCMYGIQPTYDKLLQLSLYKQIIDAKFNVNLPIISGGSSITLPLVNKPEMPKNINHLRIGESAFMGTTPLNGKKFSDFSTSIFEFRSNIIELQMKSTTPDGILTEGNIGHTVDSWEYDKSNRAIVDFGILDVDAHELKPKDKSVRFAGTTSDMTVYDLGPNPKTGKIKYKVGSKISFTPSYMAVARLMNSKFVDKKIV